MDPDHHLSVSAGAHPVPRALGFNYQRLEAIFAENTANIPLVADAPPRGSLTAQVDPSRAALGPTSSATRRATSGNRLCNPSAGTRGTNFRRSTRVLARPPIQPHW